MAQVQSPITHHILPWGSAFRSRWPCHREDTHFHREKENKPSPENKLKDKEICDLNDRELKITGLKKLNKIEDHKSRLMNSETKSMNRREYFTKKIETIKKKKEILELKNSISEMKNELASLGNIADQMED